MTLPEHVICSAMLAQFGVQQRFGWKGTLTIVAAGMVGHSSVVAVQPLGSVLQLD